MLVLKKLTCSYDAAYVLDHISLTLNKGEICVIIGQSGCGKSTLIKCLAGLGHLA